MIIHSTKYSFNKKIPYRTGLVVSQFTLFGCKICFVTIRSILCEEKLNFNCVCGGKLRISGMIWKETQSICRPKTDFQLGSHLD